MYCIQNIFNISDCLMMPFHPVSALLCEPASLSCVLAVGGSMAWYESSLFVGYVCQFVLLRKQRYGDT